MGLYIYITEKDRVNMRKVKDINVNELFQEALEHDDSLMISGRIDVKKRGFFKKPVEISHFTVYHERPAYDGSPYQARIQTSASGSEAVVTAYLYGIINGAFSVKNGKFYFEKQNNKK